MKAVLFVMFGVGIAYVIGRLLAARKDAQATQRRTIQNAVQITNDITQVGKGGVLKLPPFGPQRTPLETFVKTRHRYTDGGQPWYELVCEGGNRAILVEWERDGNKIEISAGYEDGNPRLKELGLSEIQLSQMDEAGEGDFEWDGTVWHYDDSGEVTCFEDDGRHGEAYYAWDFESDDGRYIGVEKWEGERKFGVYLSWKVDASRVEIFSA